MNAQDRERLDEVREVYREETVDGGHVKHGIRASIIRELLDIIDRMEAENGE